MTDPEEDCGPTHTRRESALDVARRLGHELPTEAEQAARLDREYPAADTDCSLGDTEKRYETWFEFLHDYYLAGVMDGGHEDERDPAEIRQWIIDDGLDPDGASPVGRICEHTRERGGTEVTDTEILNWLIANDVIAVGNFMGGQTDRVRTASGCGCCTDTLDTPPDVLARLTTPENVETPSPKATQ